MLRQSLVLQNAPRQIFESSLLSQIIYLYVLQKYISVNMIFIAAWQQWSESITLAACDVFKYTFIANILYQVIYKSIQVSDFPA